MYCRLQWQENTTILSQKPFVSLDNEAAPGPPEDVTTWTMHQINLDLTHQMLEKTKWREEESKTSTLPKSGHSSLHLFLCLKQTLRAAAESDGEQVSSTRLPESSELRSWEIRALRPYCCWQVGTMANPQGIVKKSLCFRKWEAGWESGLLWIRQNCCFWAGNPGTALGTDTHLLPKSSSVSFVFPPSQQALWLCWECFQHSGTQRWSATVFKMWELQAWAELCLCQQSWYNRSCSNWVLHPKAAQVWLQQGFAVVQQKLSSKTFQQTRSNSRLLWQGKEKHSAHGFLVILRLAYVKISNSACWTSR